VTADWFYSEGDQRRGPVTEDDLKRLVTEGRLQPSDLVWQDGMADWVEARTVAVLFPPRGQERPERRRFDGEDDRPTRRQDDFDDRPGRRRYDEHDPDDDRPRVRRREDDYGRDDDYDRPRRKRNERPGQVQGIGIMMLVGGILGLITALSISLGSGFICCLWPGIYFEIVVGILMIIRGVNMMNQDNQGPPRTLAIMQIIFIVNGDIINCVLGIVSLIMLNDAKVQNYYLRKGFA
jgi:GYF domain 2